MVKLTKNNGYTVLSSEGLVFDKKTGSLKKKDKPKTGREEKEKKRRPGPKQRRQRGPRSPRGEETSPKQREGQRGRRGIGIAVKGGGRIL